MAIDAQLADLALDSLLDTCRRLDVLSVSVFGSAATGPVEDATDLDVHVVVPLVDRRLYSSLVGSIGPPWLVEPRHGPFKPVPDDGNVPQLHLVLDDLNSIELSPWAVRLHRAATGRHLLGTPPLPAHPSPTVRRHQARRELLRWRTALIARQIPFCQWRFDPVPRLVEERARATTAWELRCLLQAASTSSDLQFRLHSTGVGAPLVEHLGAELERWQLLPARWGALATRAVRILDGRLRDLGDDVGA